uniref:Uncharacterized protein n=1 Tax=Meloidogyne enterolobii TaxID=390850 RepID=A0A6V7WUE3_MELEN|nr:unnamed protein product [Meloidogyne enterolobii]
MSKRNSSEFSPLNFAANMTNNEKRSKIVEEINFLNFDKISTEMEQDKTTPNWAKLIIGQMGSLLKIAANLLNEQQNSYGNFELHLQKQQQQLEENERLHSIVITGMEESNKQDALERMKEDQNKVLEVINMCKVDIGLPKIKLFADDVKVYVIHKTKNERRILTDAIKNIEQWATKWKLNIAINKTYIIYLGKTNPKDQYKIFDTTINEVDSIRDLGIIIDNKLKFQEHVQKIIRAAYIKMNFVFKIIKSKSIKTWLTIYKSYIRPLLEYSPETWNPQLRSEINKLEKCQKFFTKSLLRKCSLPYIPYLQRLEFLNLPTLENRRKTYDLVLAHRILHGYTHLKSDNLFKISNRKKCYLLSKNQNSKSSNSFVNRVTKMWNVLHEEIRTTKITLSFKNKIKAILIQ